MKPHPVLPAHPVPDSITKPPWYFNPGQAIDYGSAKPEVHGAEV